MKIYVETPVKVEKGDLLLMMCMKVIVIVEQENT